MTEAIIILTAVSIDAIFGDPRYLPHITRLTGQVILMTEWVVRKVSNNIFGGCLLTLIVILSILGPFCVIRYNLYKVNPTWGMLLDIFVLYQSIAAKDLLVHVKAVLKPLKEANIDLARKNLSMVVGRDTANLDENGIAKACVETTAESLNDGIIAPLFWMVLLGGAPGALLFRIVNTLDSMVGHRDEAYEKIGKCSARLDDILGWIPSRLCGLLISLHTKNRKWDIISSEAKKHASPNAGWPESAMAHRLDIQLGGDNHYDGILLKGPIFNPNGDNCEIEHISQSTRVIKMTYLYAIFIFIVITVFV